MYILSKFFTSIGTRLRAPEQLLTQLQYEEEIQQAEESGFHFPRVTTDQLQLVLNAFADQEYEHHGQVETEVEIEEEHEWDVGEDEDEMELL